MYGGKLVTRNPDWERGLPGGGKPSVPKNKIPLFLKVWDEIKEMGGKPDSDSEARGFSKQVVEGLIYNGKLSIEMAHKILQYHKKLKKDYELNKRK